MNDDRPPAPGQPAVGPRDEAACAEAVRQERRRLSHELHDSIAQDLVSIGYLLENHAADCPMPHTESRATVAAAREHVSSTRTALRRIIDDLRGTDTTRITGITGIAGSDDAAPGDTAGAALGRSLERFAHEMADRHGFTAHVDCSESTGPLDDDVVEELDRIAREAITNVARHSGALALWVTVRVDAPAATVIVADDGVGITAARDREHETVSGHGVAIMTERAERIGGYVNISDRSGGGTVVTVSTGEEFYDDGARLRNPGRRP